MGLSAIFKDFTNLKGIATLLVSLESFVSSAEGQALIADAKALLADAEKVGKDLAVAEAAVGAVETIVPAV